MTKKKNVSIRAKAKSQGVALWQVAEKMGIADCAFSRKLRKEMNAEETTAILNLIDLIAEENNAVAND